MPLTHVQTVHNGGLTVTTVSVTLTLTAGNAVLVTLMLYTASDPTQTAGDTLTARVSSTVSGGSFIQYSNYSVVGGSTTFTFTFSSTNVSLFVTEVSGLDASAAFDQSAVGAEGSGTTHSSGTTPTTTQADAFLLAVFHGDGSGSSTLSSVSNGFTIPTNGDKIGAGSWVKCATCYKIVSATGAYETTFTTADLMDGRALIGTYKAAAGEPSPTTKMFVFPRRRGA